MLRTSTCNRPSSRIWTINDYPWAWRSRQFFEPSSSDYKDTVGDHIASLAKVKVGDIHWSPYIHGSSPFIMEVNQVGQIAIHKHVLLHVPRNYFKGGLHHDFPRNWSNDEFWRFPQLFILTFLKIMQYFSFSSDWRSPPASMTSQRDFLQAPWMHLIWSHGPVNVEISQDIHDSNLPTLSNFLPP